MRRTCTHAAAERRSPSLPSDRLKDVNAVVTTMTITTDGADAAADAELFRLLGWFFRQSRTSTRVRQMGLRRLIVGESATAGRMRAAIRPLSNPIRRAQDGARATHLGDFRSCLENPRANKDWRR
jgi:hypothetical protein